jgi:beta-lactamase class A
MNISNKYLLLAIVFLAGGVFGFGLKGYFSQPEPADDGSRQVRQSGYKFINPLLECEVSNLSENKSLVGFKEGVDSIIEKGKSDGKISFGSVYFRDLNNGPWFGIGEEEYFSPASLLKVPLAIAYFRKSEADQTILSKELEYDGSSGDDDSMQNIVPANKLEAGKKYAVTDLINRMLIYSDNNAAQLLLANIDPDFLNKTYVDLSIEIPQDKNNGNIMTVKSYASFFRILFNGSYLNRQDSESLLEILEKSDFKDGLAAGVPNKTNVSHKFGERKIQTASGDPLEQLHDCGIVYYPNHPYLLCVMTKGGDFEKMSSAIEDISRSIYQKVDGLYK